jgi:hypothetical protein
VTCCMWPKHNAALLLREQFRIHGNSDTGHWHNTFQYCEGKCRTHKRSTEHENRYIDDRHFCFSDSARPRVLFLVNDPYLHPQECPSLLYSKTINVACG